MTPLLRSTGVCHTPLVLFFVISARESSVNVRRKYLWLNLFDTKFTVLVDRTDVPRMGAGANEFNEIY